ncbi:MAG TPA: hypothetical protein VGZ23_09585 [bacterium]|nr:hypothetical protein [bacterium]
MRMYVLNIRTSPPVVRLGRAVRAARLALSETKMARKSSRHRQRTPDGRSRDDRRAFLQAPNYCLDFARSFGERLPENGY